MKIDKNVLELVQPPIAVEISAPSREIRVRLTGGSGYLGSWELCGVAQKSESFHLKDHIVGICSSNNELSLDIRKRGVLSALKRMLRFEFDTRYTLGFPQNSEDFNLLVSEKA